MAAPLSALPMEASDSCKLQHQPISSFEKWVFSFTNLDTENTDGCSHPCKELSCAKRVSKNFLLDLFAILMHRLEFTGIR
jgi:hypothetical protein